MVIKSMVCLIKSRQTKYHQVCLTICSIVSCYQLDFKFVVVIAFMPEPSIVLVSSNSDRIVLQSCLKACFTIATVVTAISIRFKLVTVLVTMVGQRSNSSQTDQKSCYLIIILAFITLVRVKCSN